MIAEIRHIDCGGSHIEYSVTGNGPSVMLVHGFGEDSRIWKHQAAYLSTQYRLILPDLPGSGKSAMIGQANASMEAFAECLRAILENENTDRCIMLGHSMGGYITLAMAEKYPEKLQGFGLIHSTAFADNEEKINARKKGIDFIKTRGAREFLKTSIPGLFHDPARNSADIGELLSRADQFTTESLCQYYKAMMARPDRRDVISNSKIPFLLVAGVYDQAVPFNQSLMLASLAENTEIHILRKSGHMGMLEETEKCSRIFGSFLANPFIN